LLLATPQGTTERKHLLWFPPYRTINRREKTSPKARTAIETLTGLPLSAYRTNELVARTEKGIAPTRVISIYPIQTEVLYSEAGVKGNRICIPFTYMQRLIPNPNYQRTPAENDRVLTYLAI
jgi:hypothetical protein